MKDEEITRYIEEMDWVCRNFDVHLTDAEKKKLNELWFIFIGKVQLPNLASRHKLKSP